MTEVETKFDIPEINLVSLQTKITKLNKRAVKLGCEPITLEVLEEYFEGTPAIKYAKVEVIGKAPQYNGWSFAAKLDPTEAGNLIRAIPGIQIPEKYKTSGNYCDHCKMHRDRKTYYILQNEAGTFCQVGKNCLKDFLGHTSPQAMANWAQVIIEFLGSIGSDYGSSNTSDAHYKVKDVLASAIRVIRTKGFTSTAAARDHEGLTTTSDEVSYVFFNPPKGSSKLMEMWRNHVERFGPANEAAQANATDIMTWIENQENNSDYIHNLKVVNELGWIKWKEFGLLVSVAWVWMKEAEKAEYQRKSKEKANDYLGEKGKRETWELTYVGHRWFDSQYNDKGTCMVKFEDAKGNSVVWWTSAVEGDDTLTYKDLKMIEGDTYTVKGTVKDFREYKGRNQTIMARCAVGK